MKSSVVAAPRPGCGRVPAAVFAVAVAIVVALTGCGDSRKDKSASQVAAKVNKEELSVHQINYVLQRQQGLKPEQMDAASRQVLERLIDQELAVQKASDMKLDRDPRVQQALDAARREIVARAYLEKVGESAAKPTPEEIKKYYDEKPALFSQRRIYSLQELAIEAKPEQIPAIRHNLEAAKTFGDFVEYLKANNLRFAGNQAVRPAEQLPMGLLDTLAKMKDGQTLLIPAPQGAQVVLLAGSRMEPVDETRARPAIEQFLLNDAKRKLVEADMKSLRSAAKIEYVGKFAEPAASAPPGAAATTTPAAAPAPGAAPAASNPDAAAIGKGLSGLK